MPDLRYRCTPNRPFYQTEGISFRQTARNITINPIELQLFGRIFSVLLSALYFLNGLLSHEISYLFKQAGCPKCNNETPAQCAVLKFSKKRKRELVLFS